MASRSKTSLSKHLLEMKFMKRRGRLGGPKVENEAERIDDEHWVRDLPALEEAVEPYHFEQGYVLCEELVFGRMSFKGFNPDIEKIMKVKNQEDELSLAEEREKEISVDDVEMTERYSSLVGSIGNKFKTKKKRKTDIEEEEIEEGEIIISDEEDNKTVKFSKKHASSKRRKNDRTFMKPKD